MQKKILAALLIVVAAAAVWYAVFPNRGASDQPARVRKEPAEQPSGLVIGRNAIYVADQAPSERVAVGFVVLGEPGFVVIHEGKEGAPATILGASSLISVGEANDLPPVLLSRKARDGETLFAMLHRDDGDGAFDPAKDIPVRDAGGEPLMMQFSIDKEASLPDAIKL